MPCLAQAWRLREARLPATLADLAHVAELALRSLNGLEERLHHSYALYGLLSPDRFVTVEAYILPLACLIAVLPLQVRLRVWSLQQIITLSGRNTATTACMADCFNVPHTVRGHAKILLLQGWPLALCIWPHSSFCPVQACTCRRN